MQKEMQTLWRNRVPMCIEVMLLPNCYHGVERVEGSDASLPTDKGGNILLEQWNIQVLPKRYGGYICLCIMHNICGGHSLI